MKKTPLVPYEEMHKRFCGYQPDVLIGILESLYCSDKKVMYFNSDFTLVSGSVYRSIHT